LLDQFLVLVLVADSVETLGDGHTAGTASDQSGLAFEGEELLDRSHDLCARFDVYGGRMNSRKMIRKTDEQKTQDIQVCI
jgi:hypothetical protein